MSLARRVRGCGSAIGLAVGTLACSSTSSHFGYSGTPGQATPARPWANLLLAEVSVDGVGGRLAVLDTGSPDVALSGDSFAGATVPGGNGTVDSLSFGGLAFHDAPVLGVTGPVVSSDDPTAPIAGVVGCALLSGFAVSLDYRDAQLVLGPAVVPAGVEMPGASTTFTLQGGGNGPGAESFPPSRIVVTATIEGTNYALLVDTGASDVTLRTSLFDAIASDGRAQLSASYGSTYGNTAASDMRVQSMTVAGAQVSGVIVLDGSATDALLDGIASEIGHPIDGQVGGSFLRQFFVTVDYPNRTLHLQRYLTGAPAFDGAERVGVRLALAVQGTGYPVAAVYAGTDAEAKGVAVGDSIVAIDGQSVQSLGPEEAGVLLTGPVGSEKTVQFGTTASPALNGQTIAIRVDELLPP